MAFNLEVRFLAELSGRTHTLLSEEYMNRPSRAPLLPDEARSERYAIRQDVVPRDGRVEEDEGAILTAWTF